MASLAVRSRAPLAKRHDYLTDGARLVMLRRKMATGAWMVEEATSDPEAPTLTELSPDAVRSGAWRKVDLVELDCG